MSDTSERRVVRRRARNGADIQLSRAGEIQRSADRNRAFIELSMGVVGGGAVALVSLAALFGVLAGFGSPALMLLVGVAAVVAGVPCLYLAGRGARGLYNSRAPRIGKDPEDPERELLEVIAAHGEVTPTRAALETSLTVDEAEERLSALAGKGHLDVRVEGGRLVYSL